MSNEEALKVSESYLQEMLKADDTADFKLYTQRYEPQYLEGFTVDRFEADIKGMHSRNGMNQSYEFLGQLRNSQINELEVYRTVWRGVYEKRDAVIEMGVYEKAGVWHVIKSAVY